jgi:hypothetical protein
MAVREQVSIGSGGRGKKEKRKRAKRTGRPLAFSREIRGIIVKLLLSFHCLAAWLKKKPLQQEWNDLEHVGSLL